MALATGTGTRRLRAAAAMRSLHRQYVNKLAAAGDGARWRQTCKDGNAEHVAGSYGGLEQLDGCRRCYCGEDCRMRMWRARTCDYDEPQETGCECDDRDCTMNGPDADDIILRATG